jgi:hypothetical protein
VNKPLTAEEAATGPVLVGGRDGSYVERGDLVAAVNLHVELAGRTLPKRHELWEHKESRRLATIAEYEHAGNVIYRYGDNPVEMATLEEFTNAHKRVW